MQLQAEDWRLQLLIFRNTAMVGDIVVLKSIIRPTKTVANGILKSTDVSKEVEGKQLGPDY
ncbi:unnamed protein product [Camellia sinensis]